MRKYGEETRTETYRTLKEWTCDICGKSLVNDERFDVYKPPSYKTGSSFPTGGSYNEFQFDLCLEHAEEVWQHISEKYGINPYEKEIDW